MSASPALTVAVALDQARAAGLDRVDRDVLMGALLGRDRAWLLIHDDHPLSPAQAARWSDWCARRAAGVPVAYLTGQHEFHGLLLQVTPDVLDPRPDTETLVDWALERLAALGGAAPTVFDLGTGSGAIALAIQHRHPKARVGAVDRSAAALAVARANGERLGLDIDWRQGSWFEPMTGLRVDLIVSNPPYIRPDDPHLADLRHEPREALVADEDGLADLRTLIAGAPAHLRPGGWLLLEHGHDQADAVAAIFEAAGWHEIGHRLDLGGHRRCTGARRP
ncbi:peptide chain release factor N(5)-glutamine methyltransferase [Leptothrix discophora]|uniref:Release factor glutamine methyltransferase n=1 Tax=Leptothrix discophora TaxID=89 RepID=A0ABT9G0S0_LEPDI|nr:peptide chain release factor N(5)-glutamine methyltransferase [Leptothrix discophora]MDP4299793.1 peptide chain release factor N(5)-glutamine methyltransferase [Leptothrix discophora]